MSLRVPVDQLAGLPARRGDDLVIVGPGVARGVDLSGLRFARIDVEHGWLGYLLEGYPTRLRRALGTTVVFENCDFSGLRTTSFEPGPSVFIGCRFLDVRVKTIGSSPLLVDCVVSGEWEGNFHGGEWRHRLRLRGNDFRQGTGMQFFDRLDPYANRFDLGGRHLILRRERECWRAALALAEQGNRALKFDVAAVRYAGPGRDWVLLTRDFFTDQEWEFLCADRNDPGPPPVGQRLQHDLRRMKRRLRRAPAAELEAGVLDTSEDGEAPGAVPDRQAAASEQGLEVFGPTVVFIATTSSGEAARLHHTGSPSAAVLPTPLDIFQIAELQARITGQTVAAVVTFVDTALTEHEGLLVLPVPASVAQGLAGASDDQLHTWSSAYPTPDSPVPSSGGSWDDDTVRLALHDLRRLSRYARIHGYELFVVATP